MIRRPRTPARRAGRGVALGVIFSALSLHAAPPVLDSISPAGGRRGATVAVTPSGKLDPWPVKVWTDSPGVTFEAGAKPNALTAKIAPDAPLGPHLIRVYTPDGASALRCFMVGDQPELAEVEPNDEAAKPQPIKELPVTINGLLDKSGDVDCYAVNLAAGQTLVASVQGRRLGSPIDPMLHLLGPDGAQLAFAHDGLGLDPLLTYRAEKSGAYVLRVSAFAFPPAADVKLAGSKDAVYRLSLTTGPFVRMTIPQGITRGQKATVRAIGYNLQTEKLDVDATALPPNADQLLVPAPGGECLRFQVTEGPELTQPAAPLLAAPVTVSGTIATPGQEDCYDLPLKKAERLSLTLRAWAIGSPLDGVLRVLDPKGKQVAREDLTVGDPKIEWTGQLDETYRVCVSDLTRRGGPEFVYRLEVKRPTPEVRATVETDIYALAPGKNAPIKVMVARTNGHATPMVAVATGLPPGVTVTSADVPPKGGDVLITLTAAADAKPFSGPVRLMLLATDPAKPQAVPVLFDLTKEREKPGGQAFIDQAAEVWLTVSPTAAVASPKAK